MAQEQEIFADRIERLTASHMAEQAMAGQNGPTTQTGAARQLGLISSILCACFVGFLSVAVARLILLHVVGTPDTAANPDVVMLSEGGIAACLTLASVYLLRLAGSLHMVLVAIGFWAGLLGMHNLVHQHPEGWAMLYSERWVWQVTQMTEPQSIYFRGHSYDMGTVLGLQGGKNSKAEIKINRF